jgi:hypothetical protein
MENTHFAEPRTASPGKTSHVRLFAASVQVVASVLNVSTVVQRVMSADNLSCLGCERAIAEEDQSPSMSANWKAIQSSARARSNGQKVQCFAWIMSSEASSAPKAWDASSAVVVV